MNFLLFIAVWASLISASASITFAEDLKPLRQSLTFHASFENGLDADFSRGEKTCLVKQDGSPVISPGTGRFGNSLHFNRKSLSGPTYHGRDVLNYSPESWNTTVSVWLRLNPDVDLEPGYCDPIQIVGGDSNQGFVFLEWSRDETPRLFRYAIRPLFSIWNPDNLKWDEIPPAKRPMVQVENAPFTADRWTHVVLTLENVNDKSRPQSGRLFINGELMGAVQGWDLSFGWNPEKVRLVLGAAYIGRMDDLAVFDRPLTAEEIQQLYHLENGVGDLY